MINYNVSVLYISVLFVMAPIYRNKDIDDLIVPMKTVSLYLTFSLWISYSRIIAFFEKVCLDLSVEEGWRQVK